MVAVMDSYLVIEGNEIPLTPEVCDQISAADISLASKLKRVLTVVNRHDMGIRLFLNSETGAVKYELRGDHELNEFEASVLAVELHHILQNNPHIREVPQPSTATKLGKGAKAYVISVVAGASSQISVIVLNRHGRFMTSYDHTRDEFFPPVGGLKTSALHDALPMVLDELDKSYREVRKNIEEMRRDEEETSQKGPDVNIGK